MTHLDIRGQFGLDYRFKFVQEKIHKPNSLALGHLSLKGLTFSHTILTKGPIIIALMHALPDIMALASACKPSLVQYPNNIGHHIHQHMWGILDLWYYISRIFLTKRGTKLF
ncbi:hypothetical protein ACJX0J_037451 [Zea mays]